MKTLGIPQLKVNLAWYQLSRQPVRFLVAITGVATAGFLIFLQLGLLGSLFDSSVIFHRMLQADLVLISRDYLFLNNSSSFSKVRLAQSYADPAVRDVSAVLLEPLPIKDFKKQRTRLLLAVGFDPARPDFLNPDIRANQTRLKQIGSILIDRRARPEFRPMVEQLKRDGTLVTESRGARLRAVGTLSVGPTFGSDGMAVASQETVWSVRGRDDDGTIQIGLIRLDPSQLERAPEIVQRLRRLLPPDVDIMTREGFIQRELGYWRTNTPAAFVFNLGAMIGFFVGMVVVYQIIYSDVIEHLSEYGTLLAMGHPFRRLVLSLISQGLIIGTAGYPPSLGASLLIYEYIRRNTSLPLTMSLERVLIVLVSILLMTTSSAVLAMAKLRQVEPADVF